MCSSALANFFINKAAADNIPMTNLKLQKIMFVGYGWVIALIDKDLTDGEGFQAWQHGPVLPSIYHQMKRYGGGQVKESATNYDSEDNKVYIPTLHNQEASEVLDKVWVIYKDFSAWSLRNLTHKSESPWDKVYSHKSRFTAICEDDVKEYYMGYIKNLIGEIA